MLDSPYSQFYSVPILYIYIYLYICTLRNFFLRDMEEKYSSSNDFDEICICWELSILCSIIVFECVLMSGLRLSDLNKETTYLLTYLLT